MTNTPETPPAARLSGVGRAKWILPVCVLLVLAAAAGGGYVFVTHFWQKDVSADPAPDVGVDDGKTANSRDWVADQDRQLQRSKLHKLVQRAKLIREEIDALQAEIDTYQKRLNDLKDPEVAKRLIKDEWTVPYVNDKWGASIPHEEVAKDLRTQLDTLMLPVEQALSETATAYEVSEETDREFTLIQFEVSTAKKEYTQHRLVVEALAERIAEGGPDEPPTSSNTPPSRESGRSSPE